MCFIRFIILEKSEIYYSIIRSSYSRNQIQNLQRWQSFDKSTLVWKITFPRGHASQTHAPIHDRWGGGSWRDASATHYGTFIRCFKRWPDCVHIFFDPVFGEKFVILFFYNHILYKHFVHIIQVKSDLPDEIWFVCEEFWITKSISQIIPTAKKTLLSHPLLFLQ